MKELSPEARALFRSAREAAEPPPDAQARARKALQDRIARDAAQPSGPRWSSSAPLKALAVAVVALSAALGLRERARHVPNTAVVRHVASQPSPPATEGSAAVEEVRVAAPEPAPQDARPVPVAVALPRRGAANATPRRATAATRASAPSSAERAQRLAEEIRLVSQARLALRGGDGARALATVDEHRRRFPQGALATESSAVRVLALCALGRAAEARVLARAWLASSERSPLANSVRRSCAADGE